MKFSQSNNRESSRNIKTEPTTAFDNDDSDLEIIENPSKSQRNDHSNIIDLDGANHAADLERMIAAAKKTIKCPLSTQNIINPCQSTLCGHTFEKERILEYLLYHQSKSSEEECVECPQRGCSKSLKQSDLIDVTHDVDNGVEMKKDESRDSERQVVHCFCINEQDASTECIICGLKRDNIADSESVKRSRSLVFDSEDEKRASKRQRLDERET